MVGNQVVPGMLEKMLPVTKEMEVNSPTGRRSLTRVRDGSQLVHWVWVVNSGMDSLVKQDTQVVGQWEVVEAPEGWKAGQPDLTARPALVSPRELTADRRKKKEKKFGVLEQLGRTLGEHLATEERDEAL